MRRLQQLLAALILPLLASSLATAGEIRIEMTTPPTPTSAVEDTDMITVDVVMDSVSDHVTAYGVHILWTDGLSFVGVLSSGVGFPGVFWQSLAGDETIDGTGLILRKADAVDPPTGGGVFTDLPIATLQFHVNSSTTGTETITPFEDDVFDGINYYAGGQNVFTFYTDTPLTVPEPTQVALALSALGTLALLAARRRRAR